MDYSQLFDQAGRQYNVDPRLLAVQMQVESNGNPNALSNQGAQGLMQIIPATQKSLGVTNPNDPAQSINAAAQLMAENLDRYGNVADAVRAYHGGTDQSAWGPKTQAYAQKVLTGYSQPQGQPQMPARQMMPGIPTGPGAQLSPQQAPQDDLSVDFAMPGKSAAPVAGQAPVDDLASDFATPTTKTPQVVKPGTIASLVAPGLVQQPQDQGIAGAVSNYLSETGRGAIEGIQRGTDTPAEWLAKGMDASGLTSYLQSKGIDPGTYEQQVAADKARREAYDQSNPSIPGQIAKFGGEVASPTGEMGAAGKALSYGGNALLNGLRASEAGAAVAPALAQAGQFVSGGGGLLSRIANMSGQGAVGSALTSGGGNETPIGDQMRLGALLGAGLPIAGSALSSGAKFGVNLLKANVQPFTEGGQEAIVNKLIGGAAQKASPNLAGLSPSASIDEIAQAAGSQPKSTVGQAMPSQGQSIDDALASKSSGAPVGADFSEYIPGSKPTLAQATGNSGIAELERAMISRNSAPFTALEQANNNARGDFLNQIRGTPETLNDLVSSRDAVTGPLREAALSNVTGPADVKPLIGTIKDILASPEGQRDAVVSAMNKVLGKLQTKDGSLQTDPAQLYGIRKSINDQLETVAGKDNSEAAQASSQLLDVKKALDQAIEPVAPGFGDYVKTFADMSRPIDAQRYLQAKDLTGANGNSFSLNKTKNLMLQIQKMQSAPGANMAKSITPEQMQGLQALHMDLQREANSMLGTGKNSATVQLLNGNNLINQLAGNPLPQGLGAQGIGAGLGYAMGGPVGAGLGGFLGNHIGQAVSNAAGARAPEIESKLVDLLLGNGGRDSLRSLAPNSQPSGMGNMLQRGLGGFANPQNK